MEEGVNVICRCLDDYRGKFCEGNLCYLSNVYISLLSAQSSILYRLGHGLKLSV